jgi:hypothetical protein
MRVNERAHFTENVRAGQSLWFIPDGELLTEKGEDKVILLLDMPAANSLRSFLQVKGKGQELKGESFRGWLLSFDLRAKGGSDG